MRALLFLFFLFAYLLHAEESLHSLMQELEQVRLLDLALSDKLPFYTNHLMQGGYFNMPSARMGNAGEIGIGWAEVHPYRIYSLRMQLIDMLEVTGNYRIFKGVEDPHLTKYGFGDLSDKGINVKLALFRPEDSDFFLPGVAVGLEDFVGTKSFSAQYIAMTKVFLKEDFELSIGYGKKRIKGLFGGALWLPFRRGEISWLRPLALAAEFDATPYKSKEFEKHPKGRRQKTRVNLGVKTKLWDFIECSISYVRGIKWAGSVGISYNLGESKGLLPKIDDPLCYSGPKNFEPIGCNRSERQLAEDLAFAFDAQNFDLLSLSLGYSCDGKKQLRMQIFSRAFRAEDFVKEHVAHILAQTVPKDIEEALVVICSEGFPVQEIPFLMSAVRDYVDRQCGFFELKTISATRDVTFDPPYSATTLFRQPMEAYNFYLEPKTNTFFGSSKGKFKYSLGLHFGVDGFFPNNIQYSVLLGLNLIGSLKDVKDVDKLNPSQIINVRSDSINYFKNRGVTLDRAYLQKNWTLGSGFFTRFAAGYFEEAYAGLYGEALWYPYALPYAVGVEGGMFKKRSYKGLGFQEKLRKLKGYRPTYHRFFLSQAFVNFYYRWFQAQLDFKLSIGKFLANDLGARLEVFRYFPSGLEISIWLTRTNGGDRINGKKYHDKGIGFSMPLDIFYTHSSRERFGYGMSAWLRDVGVKAYTGEDLFDMISEERE